MSFNPVQCGVGAAGDFMQVLLGAIAAGNPPDATLFWQTPVALGARKGLIALDDMMAASQYAKAENWPMAKFQYKEIRGLMELGAFMRPKHEEALNQYLEENWKPLEKAIDDKDFAAFEKAFNEAIDMANAYHELKDKPYIRWKLPDAPPPDMDLKPRGPKG